MNGWQRRLCGTAVILLLLAPPAALAAPDLPRAPGGSPDSGPNAKQEEAEARLARGNELYDRGDLGAALAEFLEARRIYPLLKATYNAAVCLEKLRRYDEALDMFELVLRDFGDTLLPATKESTQRRVAKLRSLVGTIDVEGAEPGAAIVVDGRNRAEYPALAPVRVGAGAHVVRVSKTGFEPFEAHVDVAGGQSVRVAARLVALTRSGRLRVVEQSGKALDVLVDGSRVGTTPWEGQLAVGEHVVLLRGAGQIGTPPATVSLALDQTTPLTLAAEDLDASLRVTPTPPNANVAIDAVTVGHGVWEGRLRAGEHRVEVAAPGFLPAVVPALLAHGEDRALPVSLERDPTSPFAPKMPRRPRFILESEVGVSLSLSFRGDVAGSCSGACALGVGTGFMGVLRGGYELGSGLSFGIEGGALSLRQHVMNRSTTLQPVDLSPTPTLLPDEGLVEDQLRFRGGLAAVWGGWSFFSPISIHFRLGLGAVTGVIEDARAGEFVPGGARPARGGGPCPGEGTSAAPCYRVGVVAESHRASMFYLSPEVRAGLALGRHVELNVGLEAPFLITGSPPTWNTNHLISAGPDGAGTFGQDALMGGLVIFIVPSVGARYDF